MTRFQIVMSAEEHDAYRRLAKRAGLSFSAWVREAARLHARREHDEARFTTAEEVRTFFKAHDATLGEDPEPDWEEQKALIEEGSAKWFDAG